MLVRDRLALEHLTVPSASPLQLVELAASQSWRAATVLVSPFGAFPQTETINLTCDAAARRAVRRASSREGVSIALAYPFVLSRRTDALSLRPALEAAAEIGAKGVGFLVFERDRLRAEHEIEAFCALATKFGQRPVLEFFGGSAVRTLASADGVGGSFAAVSLGLCVDLLHLVRSGGQIADLSQVRTPILHAQLSDAHRSPTMEIDAEAAYGRLELGHGDLDIRGFVGALPASAWLGVEIPPAGLTSDEEVARAIRIMTTSVGALDAAA